jgi:hypothetical protein
VKKEGLEGNEASYVVLCPHAQKPPVTLFPALSDSWAFCVTLMVKEHKLKPSFVLLVRELEVDGNSNNMACNLSCLTLLKVCRFPLRETEENVENR